MDPGELERLIDRRLNDLPGLRAPHTLLPRVMAAAEQAAMRPWYARAWFTWPRPLQAAFTAALLVGVAGAAMWLPSAYAAVGRLDWGLGMFWPTEVVRLPRGLDAGWETTRVLWRVLVEPVIGYVVMFVLVMSAACVAFGTVLDRVALGGASEL